MARLAHGDVAQAEQAERDALGIDDKYSLAWFGLGKALVAEQKGQPAADAFSRAVELAPGLLDARLELADLLVRTGQLDDAARICAAAVSDSPDIAPVFTKLAEISAKQKKYDDSLAYCQAARRLAPYAHPPKVILAVYCYQNGEQKKALELLNAAHAETPAYPMTALLLGQLARRDNRLDEARRDFTEAAADPIPENWPDSHRQRFLVLLHSERFQLAQQLHDTDLARDALAQWLKCDPENREAKRLIGELGAASVK
jgi:tetratricopeptide (TPR) repeat protein